MPDLEDLALAPLLRGLLAVGRALVWLVWEFLFMYVGWFIGWPICRVLSLGRFPGERIGEVETAPLWVALIVELCGLATLAAVIVLISS